MSSIAPGGEGRETPDREPPQPRVLSLGTRVLLLCAGWILLLIGVAGLALPGIQGVLTIGLAVAVLSVASQRVHRVTRQWLARWPRVLEHMDRFREKLHDRLHRDR